MANYSPALYTNPKNNEIISTTLNYLKKKLHNQSKETINKNNGDIVDKYLNFTNEVPKIILSDNKDTGSHIKDYIETRLHS